MRIATTDQAPVDSIRRLEDMSVLTLKNYVLFGSGNKLELPSAGDVIVELFMKRGMHRKHPA